MIYSGQRRTKHTIVLRCESPHVRFLCVVIWQICKAVSMISDMYAAHCGSTGIQNSIVGANKSSNQNHKSLRFHSYCMIEINCSTFSIFVCDSNSKRMRRSHLNKSVVHFKWHFPVDASRIRYETKSTNFLNYIHYCCHEIADDGTFLHHHPRNFAADVGWTSQNDGMSLWNSK